MSLWALARNRGDHTGCVETVNASEHACMDGLQQLALAEYFLLELARPAGGVWQR